MDAKTRGEGEGEGEGEVVSPPASSPSPTRTEDDDRGHFSGLMDENGIIGLLEALEIVGVGDDSDESAPVEAETQLGEMGSNRSRSPSPRKSPGEDVETLPGWMFKAISIWLNGCNLNIYFHVFCPQF